MNSQVNDEKNVKEEDFDYNEDSEFPNKIEKIKQQIKKAVKEQPDTASILFKTLNLDSLELDLANCIELISIFKNSELCQKTNELYNK